MTKQIYDNSIGSGGTDTATFEKTPEANVALRISGDIADLDVSLNGVKVNANDETSFASPGTSESHTTLDTSSDDQAVRFVEVDAYEEVEFQFTNNDASSGSITVDAEGYLEP